MSRCNLSPSYATKYMTISAHVIISDSTYWPQLPRGVEVLYQLALLFSRPEQFNDALASGTITANLTVEDAKRLSPSNIDRPPAGDNKRTADSTNGRDSMDTTATNSHSVDTITPEAKQTKPAECQQTTPIASESTDGHSTGKRKGKSSWKSETPGQQFYLTVAVPLTDDTASEAERKNWDDLSGMFGTHLISTTSPLCALTATLNPRKDTPKRSQRKPHEFHSPWRLYPEPSLSRPPVNDRGRDDRVG